MFGALGDGRWAARTRLSMAALRRRQEKWGEAREHAGSALDTFRKIGDHPAQGWAFRELGTALREQGRYDEAGEAFAKSERPFADLGDHLWQAKAEVRTVSLTEEREVLTTLLDDVTKLHEVARTLPDGDERARTLESVAERWLASAPGMRPSIAAAMLGLSEPTVRAWARRGIFRIRARKPRLQLDPASVLEVRQLVADLRHAGQTRGLLDAVYTRLADDRLLTEPDLQESLGQMHRGEYITRRPAG